MKHALIIAIALLAGCASQSQYFQGQTVGHVGCPESEIVISDGGGGMGSALSGSQTWTATCRGVVYYCVHHRQGMALDSGQRGTKCQKADG